MHTKTDLLKGNILKSLILFAIPLIISNLFQQLYNAADTMIVGHFLGDESLAAIGACAAVYELLVGFALGFGNGLSMVVARSFGSVMSASIHPTSISINIIIIESIIPFFIFILVLPQFLKLKISFSISVLLIFLCFYALL